MTLYAVMNLWGAIRALCQVHAALALDQDQNLRVVGRLAWRSRPCEECP